ncbi:MAG TPA: hypothetical protein VFH51_18210, partial [Myxococcota bacterium]|nr:hypothetical protein [Myxococcota bacterium]
MPGLPAALHEVEADGEGAEDNASVMASLDSNSRLTWASVGSRAVSSVGTDDAWSVADDASLSASVVSMLRRQDAEAAEAEQAAAREADAGTEPPPWETESAAATSPRDEASMPNPEESAAATSPRDEAPTPNPEEMLRQPSLRPITQDQLVAEVKGIYAGLAMVEAKCREVDAEEMRRAEASPAGAAPLRLRHEQWKAMTVLHRTLLHEHHDFLLASHHDSASPALKALAAKHGMPGRLWKHGIHAYLELLRTHLPQSREHMLEFLSTSQQMMALLVETNPAFTDTWKECLGDLARYRMAISEDAGVRQKWTEIARGWYEQVLASDPGVGRLYHQLAVLAPDTT